MDTNQAIISQTPMVSNTSVQPAVTKLEPKGKPEDQLEKYKYNVDVKNKPLSESLESVC